jgi:hypothetical protein
MTDPTFIATLTAAFAISPSSYPIEAPLAQREVLAA